MRLDSIFLVLAQMLFLWMFLATEPLELMADRGMVSAQPDVDIAANAYQFAARWRHGMAGHSPIYMPGFFAVAITVWPWALKRSVREMGVESVALLFVALLTTLLVQPFGASLVVNRFEHDFEVLDAGPPPSNTAAGIFRAVYTLLTFQIGIVTIQRVIALRRLFLLIIPVVMNGVLSQIRPWTVGDFTSYWLQRAGEYDIVANFSLIAVVVSAGVMFYSQWITLSKSRASGAASLKTSVRQGQGTDRSA